MAMPSINKVLSNMGMLNVYRGDQWFRHVLVLDKLQMICYNTDNKHIE